MTEPLTAALPSLREKAERHIVYPLNRDECLALVDGVEALRAVLREVRESQVVENRVTALCSKGLNL
jgi:hypothetical protein